MIDTADEGSRLNTYILFIEFSVVWSYLYIFIKSGDYQTFADFLIKTSLLFNIMKLKQMEPYNDRNIKQSRLSCEFKI